MSDNMNPDQNDKAINAMIALFLTVFALFLTAQISH